MSILFCFKSLIEDCLSIYLIPVLRRFECSHVSDMVFLLVCVWLVVWACKSAQKGCKPKGKYPLFAWGILFLWVWYRFFDSDTFVLYKLYSFNGDLPICYVDGIAVGCVAILLVRYFHKETKVQYRNKGFLSDKPIDYLEDDALNREENARDAARKLLGTNTEECAFTFGIVGLWGDGKTSFLNMMKRSIEKESEDDVIMMDYSPWLYNEAGNITREFFKVLRSQLSEYCPAISNEIAAYSDALTAIDSPWSKYLNTLVALMTRPQTAEVQYERLKHTLKSIVKKIVVFVDDIDRLGAKEMSEVFRLVRNTSNLPHMYFVLAYDKEHVVNTLQQEFGRNSISFTDKIMQEEYPLPKIQKGMLKKALLLVLRDFADTDEIKIMEDTLVSDSFFKNDFFELASTLRDIKRLGNRLRDHYERMRDDVLMRDYLLICLLQQKFPVVYELISSRPNEIFIDDGEDKICLYDRKRDKSEQEAESQANPFLRQKIANPIDIIAYLDGDKDNALQVTEKHRKLLKSLLCSLWSSKRDVAYNGINHKLSYHRYFSYNILEQEMTEQEFRNFWKLDYPDMKTSLESLVRSKSEYLVVRLTEMDPQNEDELKKLLHIMFYVNNKSCNAIFNGKVITKFLTNFAITDSKNEKLIKSKKNFVRQLMLENKDCRGTVDYLANLQCYASSQNDFPLSIKELSDIKHNLFLNYASLKRNNLDLLSHIFLLTARIGDKKYDDVCVKVLKQYAIEHFEDFVPKSISYYGPKDGGMYGFNWYPRVLWGSNDEYIRYVEERNDTSETMIEYKQFCWLMKGKKENDAIKFSFQKVNVFDN